MNAEDLTLPVLDSNTDRRLRVGIVGLGKMGHLHFKSWFGLARVCVVAVADTDPALAPWAHARQVPFFRSSADLVGHVDAAIIATPAHQHALCASPLLAAGIHCLIEKPIAPNFAQALELVNLARRHRAVLTVGHSERFNPAYKQVQAAMDAAPKTVEVFRQAGVPQRHHPGVDVVLDLMVHDLDWMLSLLGADVSCVRVVDARWLQDTLAAVQCEIIISNHIRVVLTASYLDPHRRREIVVSSPDGSTQSISLDGTYGTCPDDPLTLQALAFVQAIRGRPSCISTGEEALKVMSMVDHIREEARKKYVQPV